MNNIDLHIHSIHSLDGQYTCQELIDLCHAAGLKTIAITDHNHVGGIAACMGYAKKVGITVIPGIEIDCVIGDIQMHMLGYKIDYLAPVWTTLYNTCYEREANVSRERIEKVNQLGFDLSPHDILKTKEGGIVTPEDIAEILLADHHLHDHPVLKPYLPHGNRSDNPPVNFYWDYFTKDKPCYMDMTYPTAKDIIHMIIDHGGIPVIAHPGATFQEDLSPIHQLIALGAMGIEVFSSYHHDKQCRTYYDMAKQHDLYITAGSDFHGKHKPSVSLGGYRCFLDTQHLLHDICG